MPADSPRKVHPDFAMVERERPRPQEEPDGLRATLRTAYDVPTDTFVTADIPLLLTKLSRPASQ